MEIAIGPYLVTGTITPRGAIDREKADGLPVSPLNEYDESFWEGDRVPPFPFTAVE